MPLPAPLPTYRSYPNVGEDACYRAKDHDTADLCAQWRAAFAAEKSAHEARRATNWAIVSTVLSAFGFAVLMFSLGQTERSLRETRRGNILSMRENARSTRRALAGAKETAEALSIARQGADAAAKQVDVMQSTAQRQLRAYLVITDVTPFQLNEDGLHVELHVANRGLTPAKIDTVRASVWVHRPGVLDPLAQGPPPTRYYHLRDWLANGIEDKLLVWTNDDSGPFKDAGSDEMETYVYGRIEYRDVFDHQHWVTFAYRVQSAGYSDTCKFMPCVHGNQAD